MDANLTDVIFNMTADSDVNGTNEGIDRIRYVAYQIALPTISGTGILSNVLNLVTLRDRNLQSVAYKHIRAVALYDFVGLILVLGACIRIAGKTPPWYYLVVYQAYFELPLLNGFLAASLFTAVALSFERYFLICRPLAVRSCQPQLRYRINVLSALAVALLMHLPMSLEYTVRHETGTAYRRVPNQKLHQQHARVFSVYEIFREVIRCLAVLAMLSLNFAIIRALRAAGQRRKRMRGSGGDRTMSWHVEKVPLTNGSRSPNKQSTSKSYEENRITTMMIGMSIVYVIGNLPQACLMPFNEDQYDDNYTYQMFRAIANLAEINNHCLNFYIFCFTSKDYYTAFFKLWGRPRGMVNNISSKIPSMTAQSINNVTRRASISIDVTSHINSANPEQQEIFV